MLTKTLKENMRAHEKWLNNNRILEKREQKPLSVTDSNIQIPLTYRNLSNASFNKCNFLYSLEYCNLSETHIYKCNFDNLFLDSINLSNSSISYSSFEDAYFKNCNLSYSNITRNFIEDAYMYNCDLRGCWINPFKFVTNIRWSKVSEELTLELMRWDALIRGTAKMNNWKRTSTCPFSQNDIRKTRYLRGFRFEESRDLWVPGAPTMDMMKLFKELCKDHKIKI